MPRKAIITQEGVLLVADNLHKKHGRKITRKELANKIGCSWSAIDQKFATRKPLYEFVETPQEVLERHKRDKIGAYRVDPYRGCKKKDGSYVHLYRGCKKKDGSYVHPSQGVPKHLLERMMQFATCEETKKKLDNLRLQDTH